MSTIWCCGDEPLAVRERDREDVRQRAGGQGGREGRRRPVVFLGLDRDPGVLVLELADLLVQGVDRFLGHAGAQGPDHDRDGLVLGGG